MVDMSIETKAMFLNSLQKDLEKAFDKADVSKILITVSNQLSRFLIEVQDCEIPMEDDLLSTYLSALQIQGRSLKTIARYKYLIERLLSSIKVQTREITVYHLRDYLSREKARGISSGTLEGLRQTFSAYFNWLLREGLLPKNPAANIGSIKGVRKVKTVYSDIDIEKLKHHCKNIRDRAIICFLLSTGCRISEMTQLNIQDVDLSGLECTVLGKGNKERTVYLDPVAGMTLKEYLNNRKDFNDALFTSIKTGKRLNPGGIRAMMKKLSKDAHVEHVHPHKFRRTRATKLIKHGMPIQEVAAILGHEKLDTTMEYVIMNKNDVKNAYQRYA